MADYASELAELLPETPGDGSKGIGINLRRLLKMRARYMIGAFVLLMVPAAAFIWINVPATYTATALLEFKSTTPRLVTQQVTVNQTLVEYSQYVTTQIDLMSSYDTVSQLLEDEAIMALPSIQKAADGPGVIGYLIENTEAEVETYNSNLVALSFKTPSREDSIAITNALANAYLANARARESNYGGDQLAAMRIQEEALVKQRDSQEEALNRRARELQVAVGAQADPSKEIASEVISTQLIQARKDQIAAQGEQSRLEDEIERFEQIFANYQANPSKQILYADIEKEINEFQEITLLNEAVSQLQTELTTRRQLYNPGQPQLRETESQLTEKLKELERTRAELRGQVVEEKLSTLRQDLNLARNAERDAGNQIANLEKQQLDMQLEFREKAEKQASIDRLQQDMQVTEDKLRDLRNEMIAIETNSIAPPRASLAMPAATGDAPSHRDRIKFLLLAAMFSVTLAAALGILLEISDQNIRSAQDVAYVSDLPVIATIPHSKEERFPRKVDMATIAYSHPNSMTADQFRQTVARLLHWSKRGQEVKTCAIMSPNHGDGKTTLAANLAIALAQADRKVLLVDIDSRNPSIENIFGLEPGPGLSEMLSRDQLARDPDRQTEFENLYVLGPGTESHSLSERLASKEMKDFLGGAGRLFDNVIIDTPAILLASEPKLIAPLVDGVVFVAGAGKLTFGKMRRGIRMVEECGGLILGIVISGVRHTAGGYLRENIKAYYRQNGSAKHQKANGKNGHGHAKPKKSKELVGSRQDQGDEEL